jgi:PAS domain S-box-containing protein
MEQALFSAEAEPQQEIERKQAMLAAIIDSSEDAIVSKTLEGFITSWNKSAQRIFGYDENEVIGKHISILIPKDKLQEEDMILERIRAGLRVQHFETLRLTKAGKLIPISLTISPIRSKDGKIIGASKIARDITDQVKAQQELHMHAQNQELLLSVANAIVGQLDLQVILQKITDITTKLTGAEFGAFFYNHIDAKGEAYMLYTLSGAPKEAFEKLGMPRNTAVFATTFTGEGVLRSDDIRKDPRYGKNEPHHGMPKGHLPVVSYLAVPVNAPSGKTIGGLFFGHSQPGVFKPEHERLLVSIATQGGIAIDNIRLYEEIKMLNERKDEFIGVAAHELRTPITTIKGYLQLLEDHAPDVLAKDLTERAIRQVNKLNRLIADLLDASKIQAGKLEYGMISHFLLPLIRESVDVVSQIYPSHTIETHLPSEDIIVTADGMKIEQVLINLLTNAVKYSSGADKIILRVTREKDRVLIGIQDFGLGIAQEHVSYIFHAYYRVEKVQHSVGGMGIGLYISKEIIERHNGQIWVESEEGKGSTFYFTLPIPD